LAQPDITAGRPTVRAVPSTIARVVVRAPRPAHTLAAVPVPTRSPPARAATATLAPKSPLAAKQVALRGAAAVAVPPHAPVPPQILSFRLLRSGLTSVGTLCLQVAHAQRVAVHASPGGEVPLPVAAASGVRVCTHVRPHSNTRYELEAQGDGWQSFREVVAIENSPSHR
ncbi:MAG: hypothetical protein ACREM2_09270, partial [Vulcanimicrobiaceae bacterium]